jgi:two-component system, response regulator FlrC
VIAAPSLRRSPTTATADPVAESPAMREAFAAAGDVAETSTTVLLLGESGTGKEVLARFIHRRSLRADGPWIAVNCAALPGDLLESELFGHERGAFTGATDRHTGRFEQASGGTLLLDEISELPLGLQAKLLRVIQEHEIDRLGGQHPIPVDVRLIASTNCDLEEMVARGRFRSDLYYRLNVFPIHLPPLRERREEIPTLAMALLAETAHDLGRIALPIRPDAVEALMALPFLGNVRELRNLLERALVRCRAEAIGPEHLGLTLGSGPVPARTPGWPEIEGRRRAPERSHPWPAELPLALADLERLAIEEALRREKGNRTHAARLLGIGLRTLRNKLRAWREEAISLPAISTPGQELPGRIGREADNCPTPLDAWQARVSQRDRT